MENIKISKYVLKELPEELLQKEFRQELHKQLRLKLSIAFMGELRKKIMEELQQKVEKAIRRYYVNISIRNFENNLHNAAEEAPAEIPGRSWKKIPVVWLKEFPQEIHKECTTTP